MSMEFLLGELEDLFPQLQLIGSYYGQKKLSFKKNAATNISVKSVELLLSQVVAANTGSSAVSVRVDAGRAGFVYFHRTNASNWLVIGSAEPVFPLVNLFIQQLEFAGEPEQPIASDATDKQVPNPLPDLLVNASEDLVAAYRMQKRFLRKINWLSANISHKALHFKPADLVSGAIYWYKNFDTASIIAVADSNIRGLEGSLITFSINSLFNEVFARDVEDLSYAITQITKNAHSYNLNVTSEEEFEKLKPVELGILRIDYEKKQVFYASNGASLLLTKNGAPQWCNDLNASFSFNGVGVAALMTSETQAAFSREALEQVMAELAQEPTRMNDKGLNEQLQKTNSGRCNNDLALITIKI